MVDTARALMLLAIVVAATGVPVMGQESASDPADQDQGIVDSPEKQEEKPYETPEEPGLSVGDTVDGEITLRDREGEDVTLASLYADKPVIVTFYRGGWCPFCNTALQQWQDRLEDVQIGGAEFIAVTMEKPEYVEETVETQGLGYRVVMDPDGKVAEAFKLKFTVDEETKSKYIDWGLVVDRHNMNGKWELPAPGTFLIDTTGVVRYAFADWDYKKRADPEEVLDALRDLDAEQGREEGESGGN